MSELTITLIRFGVLIAIWAFVIAIALVLRNDLYGTRVVTRGASAASAVPRERAQRRKRASGPTHLTVTDGSMRGSRIPLGDTPILIGRNPECSLVLSDDFASGRHTRVYRDGLQWYADDLGSTNGTFVDDRRISEHAALKQGSEIRIGQTVLEVR